MRSPSRSTQAVFCSIEPPHILFPTYRPLIGEGYSLEVQRTPPAFIRLPVRRWHVVTLFLSSSACERTGATTPLRFRGQSGSLHLAAAGPAETVVWSEGLEAVHLHIDPLVLDRWAGEPVSLRSSPVVADRVLAAAVREIARVAARGGGSSATVEVFRDLCARLLDRHVDRARPRRTPRIGSMSLDGLLRGIRDDPWHGAPVSQLASACDLTRAHFTRVFSRLVGMPPHRFQLRTRIERAKHMLAQGRSVSAVAFETGFADQSHLTRMMRLYVGLSPAAYRAAAERELAAW